MSLIYEGGSLTAYAVELTKDISDSTDLARRASSDPAVIGPLSASIFNDIRYERHWIAAAERNKP
jgi:hypothetical protein